MTKENLITVPVGTTLEEAENILHEHRVEKLLVVDDQYNLKGLITVKDIPEETEISTRGQGFAGAVCVSARPSAASATSSSVRRR